MPFAPYGSGVTLYSDLSEIASGIPDDVKEVLKAEAEKVAAQARANAPVDTGELRDSIQVIDYNEPGKVGYRVVADARSATGKYHAPYAHMVEFGSVHNQPARPFLFPALAENKDDIVDAVNDKLGEM